MSVPQGRVSRANGSVGVNEIFLSALLVFALLLGGTPNDANWRILAICVVSCALLPMALLSGGWASFLRLPWLARLSLILIPLVPLAQLLPLPPDLWVSLPGRETAKAVFALLGTQNDWHPLSLTPRNTLFALLMLLPPYAAFFGALTLDEQARKRLVMVFLAVAGVSILVGLVQVGSRGATLSFYTTTHRGNLVGFFTNRNHEALMLATAAVFAVTLINRTVRDRRAAMAWSVILSLTFLAAVVGTTSRSGMGLTLVGLGVVNYVYFIGRFDKKQILMLAALIVVTLATIYLLSFSGVVDRALSRFNAVGDDDRWAIWRLSWPLVTQYGPWGSGLGSFVPAYGAIETLNSVGPSYINRVHNDYLETLIETGIPGMVVLGICLVSLFTRLLTVVRGHGRFGDFGLPAALVILLVALHSFVDYPMRTQTIAVLFAIMLALFFVDGPEKKRVRIKGGEPHGR